jgi:hypothetical protein
MAAKRAQTVSGGPRKFGSKAEEAPSPRAAPAPSSAPGGSASRAAPPGPAPGKARSGVSELQAAMARRRNANN